jgi:hypothetical protein
LLTATHVSKRKPDSFVHNEIIYVYLIFLRSKE